MLKRVLLLATILGVFACGVFFFTGSDASAHGLQTVRGHRLMVIHERRSCEHAVVFEVRHANRHQRYQVSGPRGTHPTVIIRGFGNQVIAKYDTARSGRCMPDSSHRPQQFLLRIF